MLVDSRAVLIVMTVLQLATDGDADGREENRAGSLLLCFAYVCCLRAFLSLHDFELDRVALLQAFVPLGRDGAVMYKDIRPPFTSDETVTFRIVEPLYCAFQSFHLRPLEHVHFPRDVPVILLDIVLPA
jgi:hypothetical protein